ncbi:MAG: ATP synthase F1 subunit gamma [Bacteroidetes bacterium SW_10_40_5]|nr:MAG: ATP synthase F1 subunit gamma [Bacteroidetes bacterium SW_10_40_5]
MGSLKEIRTRINSVQNTQQITRAMKMVAAAKLRKAQQAIEQMRPYSAKLKEIMQDLSGSLGEESGVGKYYEQRSVNRVLLVVVTSDKGLCGAFNNSINKLALKQMEDQYRALNASKNVDLYCIGKKGSEYFKKRNYGLVGDHPEFFNNLNYENTEAIATNIMIQFLDGKYDQIEVLYNQFKNAITYIPTAEQFLPIAESQEEENPNEQKDGERIPNYIFEPSQEEIIADLVPRSLKVNFYRMMLDSNASEHGSRMTAMDQATDNAQELIDDLKLKYNKARQAAITKEISEIVGGAEALANE